MTRIVAVNPVLPLNSYPQDAITEVFAEVCLPPDGRRELVRRLHGSARVGRRHLALELDDYRRLDDFGASNDAFIRVGVELGAQAVDGALKAAGLDPSDVDLIISTTVTGVAVPSLDARVASALGMRADVKRVPMLGLGCLAGAAGIARLHDYLEGHPDQVAVLMAVELCSLTLQRHDASTANLVASGLFGDGAAAVVAVGRDRRPPAGVTWTAPRVVDSVSHLYPDTERAMGWDIGAEGFKIVLGSEVPTLVEQYLGDDVRGFLGRHGLAVDDIGTWVAHPGGPKVMQAVESTLGLPDDALAVSWRSLAEIGNLSSASVLHVLSETLAARPPGDGQPAVLMAMGPGFCSELVLLEW
ncbi:type III polyketide synthase [Nakamurella deserti]|uniref:type III polyketide synthase n=1 Tax=Nakamurella deserti TaxID=2164074 RepID=UPI000DBE5696|nr:3-oxoacyl-[acyl-carrier-protein] synthase III C-terminal domain-containing protein [Nakamurella deserti]